MKATVLADPEKPKAKKADVVQMLSQAGIEFVERRPDIGIVVGGDGVFSHYGRVMSVPLLFVGVHSPSPTASKGYLAQAHFDDLPRALANIRAGRYGVVEYKRLEVRINGAIRGEVFTDVYLEKGADSNCLRYQVEVNGGRNPFTESAISNGVIVCTRAGSTGYYSYIDKLGLGDWFEPGKYSLIGENDVGVCHIAPTYTERRGISEHPLRYTVPWGSSVTIRLVRDADAHLFGISRTRSGIRIHPGDAISIHPARTSTKMIRLAWGAQA